MTSAHIALQLGVTKVQINYMASELLDEILFSENPIPKIFYPNPPAGFLPEGISFVDCDFYKSEICNAFPESDTKSHQRALELEKLMRDKQAPKTCYIVVSHGHFVDTIAHIYEGNTTTEMLYNTSYKFPNYCSISGIKDGVPIFVRFSDFI